ncbi:MAG: hypothetical protein ACTSUC_09795 [Promethearchaeota archaeon]
MAERSQLIGDLLYFLKTDLSSNITDPKALTRSGSSRFVATSYPQRNVIYPMITLEVTNIEERRAGMQTTAMDIILTINIRIWGKSVTQSDKLAQEISERLRSIQFTTDGSIDNDFHDFQILSNIRVDESGEKGIKSRIIQIQYKFFNVT